MQPFSESISSNAGMALPESLLKKYLGQLGARRAELAQFLARFEKAQATPGDCAATRIHAHSLKGTGRTYGFPDISATGSALENAIDSNADQTSLAALMRALIASCEAAIKTKFGDAVASAEQPSASAGSKSKLLLVDDDPVIIDALRQLLKEDAAIFTATCGEEALQIMDREKPDLVVLDDRMPGMTGIEVLEQMQNRGGLMPSQILMLTAKNETSDIIRGMSAGAVDYITKPFDPQKLASRIRGLLRCLRTTILVADDDAAVRGLLQHKLRMLGFRLLQAEDGAEAIKLVRETKPQLAIIDRMMPGLDGLIVLQKMREEETLRDIPVILLTAKRQNKDVVEGFYLGATDYIVKPFMLDEIVARALRLLDLNQVVQP